MTLKIRIAQNADASEWDLIISQSPHGTLFHQWNWLKITEKYTPSKLYPIIFEKDDKTIGVIPLFFQKKGPLRMVFSPPPHVGLFYLGPVMVGYDLLKQEKREFNYIEFQNIVDDFIKNELKANYIHISLPPSLQDPRPYTWTGYSIGLHFDYIIDLNRGPDYLIQALSKKQRQNLNRAIKRGMTVELGGKNEFEIVLNLMDLRYKEQLKVVTESRQYFLDIYDSYKDYLKIFVAKINGEIISGCIDFHYRDTHFSWIGNPKPKKHISPSPNDLLIWESIKYAHEHGCRYYVTMNAAGDKRLHSYYASKFDPELKVHFSVKKHNYVAGLLEKGYLRFLKPLQGRI